MKNELRKKFKIYRKTLNTKILSQKIKENLVNIPEYINAKNIMTYYSLADEVSTLDYFSDTTKTWFLPKIDGDNLLVLRYDKNKLMKNRYNIYEPIENTANNPQNLDLVIIPAIAVDWNGYRLGYGKGYYDRFLKNLNDSVIKVTLVFSDLFVKDVCPEKHDIKCSIVVTDKGVYRKNC